MSTSEFEKDLILLVADRNMEYALKGIIQRRESLQIRQFEYDIYVHPERDPGCREYAHDFLRPFIRRYAHALVIFDKEGCGREDTRENLERTLEGYLENSGWRNRAAVIVIDPELEIWVWSNSPHVSTCLGWVDKNLELRKWLRKKGFLQQDREKPNEPKRAVEEALCTMSKPRSSALYFDLASHVSFENCVDCSFNKLKQVLHEWFTIS